MVWSILHPLLACNRPVCMKSLHMYQEKVYFKEYLQFLHIRVLFWSTFIVRYYDRHASQYLINSHFTVTFQEYNYKTVPDYLLKLQSKVFLC